MAKEVKAKKDSWHDCPNHCPNCGADGNDPKVDNIDWDSDICEGPYYIGTCKVCGCVFHEVYEYKSTWVVEEGKPQTVKQETSHEG